MGDVDEAAEKKDAGSEALKAVHERAMRRFEEAVRPQLPVRALALAARRFADVPGAMWKGAAGDQFGDSVKLEFPKLRRALRKLDSDFRQNRVEPDFRPSGGSSDAETADTLDGLYRADSYHFKAQQARDNARAEASKGGFGAYRLTHEWADPLDKDSDYQRINPASLIADADQSVFFGPSALYDKSDAEYAFVVVATPREAFVDEYGEDKAVSWPEEFTGWREYGWFRPDTIAVADYYEIETRDEVLLIFEQEASGEEQRHWKKDMDSDDRQALVDRGFKVRERRMPRRRCVKYIMSGAEVLEGPVTIAGGNIPIVPTYGNRAYVDGVEWFWGLVQPNMDTVRVFNAVMSSLYEINTLAPYERPIFAPEQMPKNLADYWARGNIDRHPYALVNPLLDPVTGGIVSAGPVGKVEPPQVPATMAALLQLISAEASDDDQDVEQVKANTSADAMDIAAARVDAKSAIFLDNDRQSTQRAGELYLAMACEVYSEPGRVVETMTQDGDDGEATLHEDYSDKGELKVRNDFASGRYKVIADVTEATATRRDRTVKQMLNLAGIAQAGQDFETSTAALITAGLNMDGEGLDDFLKYQRQRALKIGLVQPTEDEKAEAEQQAAQAQQQPDPQLIALQAEVRNKDSQTELNQAKRGQVAADTALKQAQAAAVGGPEAVPDVPSGLQAANDLADAKRKDAAAEVDYATADQIRREQRIMTGAEYEARGAA